MSLLDDLANAFGHTIDSLAQDLGVATSDLEQIVNELAGFGIDVFSVASKVHLDPLTLLRNLVSLMKGDPHQTMISSMTAPFKSYEEPLYQLSQQWSQMAVLHQTTAQSIQQHMDELLSNSGSSTYSGPAATTLLNTHTIYQQYFTNVVVPHASTQGTRHQGLAQGFTDYLAQTPSDVYKLPKPMAALGVLGFQMLASAGTSAPPDAPPDWLSGIVQWAENTETDLENTEENLPDPPIDPATYVILAIMIVVGVILLLALAGLGIWWLWDHIFNHQNQQTQTSTSGPPAKPTPTPIPKPIHVPTTSQQTDANALAAQYGVDVSLINELLAEGYTIDEIRQLLANLKNNARDRDPSKISRYITYQLQQLINRWNNMSDAQYTELRNLGYTDAQIRLLLMTNQVSVANLIQRTLAIQKSGLEAKLQSEGYTSLQIQQMLMAGFNESQLQIVYQRTLADPTLMKTLLFGGTAPDGQQTGNIVGALLSGDSGKVMEGQVALCLLNQVTTFRQLIGPGGSTTEIDVGTANAEISVKQPGVGSSGVLSQLQQLRALYPGTKVILFAPGYANKNPVSARGIKGDGYPIVGDCASLQAAL